MNKKYKTRFETHFLRPSQILSSPKKCEEKKLRAI